MQPILKYGLSFFYLTAGLYHFIDPNFYHGLIPDYLDYPEILNYLSGILEIVFSILILLPLTRKWACYGIISLLLIFVPSHIYFIQTGSCVENSLCVSPWISWTRLLIVHPILIYWAWKVKGK